MSTLLWGVIVVSSIIGIVSYSNAQDAQRELSYNKCMSTFTNNHMPQDARESFLMGCMR